MNRITNEQREAIVRRAVGERDALLTSKPLSEYPPQDQAFYRFWYGHMLGDLMQPPLANIDHATARYIWNAALSAAPEGRLTQDEIHARDWWCPTCRKSVPPEMVTYDETHYLEGGGCGYPVRGERIEVAAAPLAGEGATPPTAPERGHVLAALDRLEGSDDDLAMVYRAIVRADGEARDALHEALETFDDSLSNWAKAYPSTVFPEPDWKAVQAALAAAGLTLDAVSASNMLHVAKTLNELFQPVRAAMAGGSK